MSVLLSAFYAVLRQGNHHARLHGGITQSRPAGSFANCRSTMESTMQEMTTEALLALLKETYPDKSWRLCPFDLRAREEGQPRQVLNAIVFTEAAMTIHDPLSTTCSRGRQTDRYGMSEDHARLLRRHNRTYEKYFLNQVPDLTHVFEQLAHVISTQPDLDPVSLLDDYGFTPWHSGGGCMAYALFLPDDSHLLVTDEEGSNLPKRMGEALVGLYDSEGSEIKLFQRQTIRPFSVTVASAVDAFTDALQVHCFGVATVALPADVKQQIERQGRQLAALWLHHSLPDGAKVKTEDGYTFVRAGGKWTDNDMTFDTLADIRLDFTVLEAD
jgi:hypothetical protein